MHNNSGMLPPVSSNPCGRYVKVKAGVRGFVDGGRFVTPNDPPFLVTDHRAAELLKAGLVEACAPVAAVAGNDVLNALHPAQQRAEKSVAKPSR